MTSDTLSQADCEHCIGAVWSRAKQNAVPQHDLLQGHLWFDYTTDIKFGSIQELRRVSKILMDYTVIAHKLRHISSFFRAVIARLDGRLVLLRLDSPQLEWPSGWPTK